MIVLGRILNTTYDDANKMALESVLLMLWNFDFLISITFNLFNFLSLFLQKKNIFYANVDIELAYL